VTSNPQEPLPALPTLGGDLPPLPSLGGDLPPLPTLGPVSRRPPVGGARRHWQQARVLATRDETANARTFRLALPPGVGRHVPGQHYDVRLTAPDGSQAQRSYSIASAPQLPTDSRPTGPEPTGPAPTGPAPIEFELTVERIADGDVSPYLHDVIRVGDEVEVRGPFGGWFIWRGDTPALLVGGGSGVVPLMAMRRYWQAIDPPVPLHLVVSVRTPEDLYYANEYGDETTVVYSRKAPADSPRPAGRLSAAVLQPLIAAMPAETVAYVCGSAGFAEHASQLLVSLGVDRSAVRVERFGPS
jgi:ferredoxin-NADP reductase